MQRKLTLEELAQIEEAYEEEGDVGAQNRPPYPPNSEPDSDTVTGFVRARGLAPSAER
jgi:hypothetical protein